MLLNQLMSQVAADDKPAIEDLFSSYVYSGTGSTRTITTGIDLSGTNAGMVWLKSRSAATDHAIYDTVRGATYDIASNLATAQTTQATGVTGFGSTGFSMGALAKINTSAATYAAWTFKKAPKFFDVVQFTAGSSTNRRISHSLGCVPGMIVIKRLGGGGGWLTYHRSTGRSIYLLLSDTLGSNAQTDGWGTSDPTTTDFGISEPAFLTSGNTYIAYLWAHDDSADGVVQCGSFTTDASGNATVNLGWEPQYVIVKASSAAGYHWDIIDHIRGFTVGGKDQALVASAAYAESDNSVYNPSATGVTFGPGGTSTTYIYLAIRRGPMRTPTDGTTVYNAISRTGTGAAATVTGVGFPVDAVICKSRSGTTGAVINDRLRGATKDLYTTATTAETTTAESVKDFAAMDGMTIGTNANWNTSAGTYINYCLRRAPGFFDTVCYTGTGVAMTIAHNLKSAPGMIWFKCRNYTYNWVVQHTGVDSTQIMYLNTTDVPITAANYWNSLYATASVINIGAGLAVNANVRLFTAYLFGDTAGLCKAFSYTGNGTNQDISLGFAPRFVLMKRTDAAGSWFVVDSTRGIVSGADPSLLLNSTSAEATSIDFIDPLATGFNITQDATNNLNVNAASYIGWASA